ncbi:shikimate dehydrogenase [Brachybacterium sacelli]|uniref:Shikimate dehydrogenase n=1 Tax=Brachybacterium sacelli TaxID=173364 RepID=A0ABS4X733_9MICO|nr:shikimate dehydrogenase [Brachybacterium sacelli]MBP2384282.1 shikimate dehydrogenase [Brachybacterium sacelli]
MSSDTARFAVVGSPVAHSLSPVLHRTAYAELGIDHAAYDRFDVPAGELAGFLAAGPGRELAGLSVTMPGKPEAFALAAETDETSRALGIANTLIRRTDGRWRAENHDVHGIVASLRDHGAHRPVTGGVLGSGATAASAVAALLELGTEEIVLSARSPHKLAPLEELSSRAGVRTRRVPWESSRELLTADVLISALAAEGAQALAADWGTVTDRSVPSQFLDVLYDPWPAPLAALVAARGGEVADGLEMLAHQAGQQVRSMLGVPSAPVREMLAAARSELAGRGRGPTPSRHPDPLSRSVKR